MNDSRLTVMPTRDDVMVPVARDAFAACRDCGVSHCGFAGNSGILKRLSLFGLLAVTVFCSRAAVVTYYVSVTNVCGVTVSIDGGAFGEGTTKRYLKDSVCTVAAQGSGAAGERIALCGLPSDAVFAADGKSASFTPVTNVDVQACAFTPTHVWTGGGAAKAFADAANWRDVSGAAVTAAPGEGDVVFIPAPAASGAKNEVEVPAALSIGALYAGALNAEAGTATLTVKHMDENGLAGNLFVFRNATLTHEQISTSANACGDENKRLDLSVGGDLFVAAGGKVSADGKGFNKGKGPGRDPVGNGRYYCWHGGARKIQYVYGSIMAPTNCGSGAETIGGGAVKIFADGNLRVNGTVSANGNDGSAWQSSSGGSVWLSGRRLMGSGVVTVKGGKSNHGPSGSGGRVAVWLSEQAKDLPGWSGEISAPGGAPSGTAAGTVYLRTAGQTATNATVIVDTPYKDAVTPLGAAWDLPEAGDVIVRNGGKAFVPENTTLKVNGSITSEAGLLSGGEGSAIEFTGLDPATVKGTNLWPGLICTVPGKKLTFGSAATDFFNLMPGSTFRMRGSAEQPVELLAENGAAWKVKVNDNATLDVRWAKVQNSDASKGYVITAYDSTDVDKNSVNWRFVETPPFGATVTWTGAEDTSWTNPKNWDPERAPVATDRAVVPGSAARMPELWDLGQTIWKLDLETGARLEVRNVYLTVTNGMSIASGAQLSLSGSDLTVEGTFACTGAVTCANAETITLYGNADFTGASLTNANSKVLFAGNAAQTVNPAGRTFRYLWVRKGGGSVAFTDAFASHDVDLRESGKLPVTFAAGKTVTTDEVHWEGVSLASSTPGIRWGLAVTEAQAVRNVTARDSDASAGMTIYTNGAEPADGNNLNWRFGTELLTWTGAKNSSWTERTNWDPEGVPGPTSRVTVASAASIACSTKVAVGNLVAGGGTGTVELFFRGGLAVADSLDVAANATVYLNKPSEVTNAVIVRKNGTLAHEQISTSANTCAEEDKKLDLTIGGDLTVEEGGKVSADGKGFNKGMGPGRDPVGNGRYYCWHGGARSLQYVYGSITAPTNCGSGAETIGGGAVKIFADGNLRVNGTVSANGNDGSSWQSSSGGSVWLSGRRLTGFGAVKAQGGWASIGPAGSGGRVAVWLSQQAQDLPDWSGEISAKGGACKMGTAAGTVYVNTVNGPETNATVILDNGGYKESFTPLGPTYDLTEFGTLVVTNGAKALLEDGATLTAYGSVFVAGAADCLIATGSTLVFAGTNEAVIAAEGQFGDIACEVPGKRVSVSAQGNDTLDFLIGSRLTLKGSEEDPLVLRAWPDPDGEWTMNLRADCVTDIKYVSVSNSNASAGRSVTAVESLDMGGNTNWGFSVEIRPNDPIYWNGSVGTAWTASDNWTDRVGGHREPAPTDHVIIPSGMPAYPVVTAADGTVFANNLTIQSGAGVSLAGGNLTVTNALDLSGTLTCSGSELVTLGGNVSFGTADAFAAAQSRVRLTGGGNASVDFRDAALNRLEIRRTGGTLRYEAGFSARVYDCVTEGPSTNEFAYGETVDVTDFFCRGRQGGAARADALCLKSTMDGVRWNLSVTGDQLVTGVRVRDSNATGKTLCADGRSTDGGDNVNWRFGSGETYDWTGAAGTNFTDAANWCPEGVPGPNANVLIGGGDASFTVNANTAVSVSNLTIGTAGSGNGAVTFRANAPVTAWGGLTVGSNATVVLNSAAADNTVAGDVRILAGALLTHDALADTATGFADETRRVRLSCDGDFTLEEGARVDVTGKGFAGLKGPGTVADLCAAHGGTSAGAEGKCYGSYKAPEHCGSGGGTSYSGAGGTRGGGAVKVIARGTVTVDGTITANGADPSGIWTGSGTGGSVWLSGRAVKGRGEIHANAGSVAHLPRAGGGGRVALVETEATTFDEWLGKATAYGGTWGASMLGGAGTVYLRTGEERDDGGTVIVDNTGPAGITSQARDGYGFCELAFDTERTRWDIRTLSVVATNRGNVKFLQSVDIGDLTAASTNLYLNHDGNTITVHGTRHRNGRHWAGPYDQIVTGPDGGRFLWKSPGTTIVVR